MWQERERWRDRVRLVVFVMAVSALLTAWWRLDNDPRRSSPLLFPLGVWLGQTPPATSRPAPTLPATDPNNARGGAVNDAPTSVGTTGRSIGARNPDYRLGPPVESSPTGTAPRPAYVAEPRDLPRRKPADKPPSQPAPCGPREGTPPDVSDAAPEGRKGVPPCEDDHPIEPTSGRSDSAPPSR
jgi:hypothetical protein